MTLLYGARREAAHIALRAPTIVLDREDGGLHRALGVAVRVAPAAQPGPDGLHAVLKSRLPRPGGADVLEHAEPPVGTEDALHFGETPAGVADAAEDEAAHDRVERAVAEGE